MAAISGSEPLVAIGGDTTKKMFIFRLIFNYEISDNGEDTTTITWYVSMYTSMVINNDGTNFNLSNRDVTGYVQFVSGFNTEYISLDVQNISSLDPTQESTTVITPEYTTELTWGLEEVISTYVTGYLNVAGGYAGAFNVNPSYSEFNDVFLLEIPSIFTFTCDPNGGEFQSTTDPSDIHVIYSKSTNNHIELPVLTGYRFQGFYDDDDVQVYDGRGRYVVGDYWKSDGTSLLKESTNLTAQWEVATTQIILDARGGNHDEIVTATYFESDANSVPVPRYYYHKFIGFWTEEEGGTRIFDLSGHNDYVPEFWTGPYPNGTWCNFEEVLWLYAHWQTEFTVIFDANGGVAEYSELTMTLNKTDNNLLPVPVNGDRPFLGWYTSSIAGTKVYDQGGIYTEGYFWNRWGRWQYEDGITLYAHWLYSEYYLSFFPMGGSSSLNSLIVYVGSAENNTVEVPTRENYHFTGWFTAEDHIVYNAGGVYVTSDFWGATGKWTGTSNLSLYAHWDGYESVMTVDPSNGSDLYSRVMKYGSDQNNVIPVPVNGYHIFDGYWIGDVQIYDSDGNAVESAGYWVNGLWSTVSNTVVKARWKHVSFLTFDKRAGYAETQQLSMVQYEPDNNLVPICERVGYRFVGWGVDVTRSEGGTHVEVTEDGLVWVADQYDTTVFEGDGTYWVIPHGDGEEYTILVNLYDSYGRALKSDDFWSDDYPDGVYLHSDSVEVYAIWEDVNRPKRYFTDEDNELIECHLYKMIDGVLTRIYVDEK